MFLFAVLTPLRALPKCAKTLSIASIGPKPVGNYAMAVKCGHYQVVKNPESTIVVNPALDADPHFPLTLKDFARKNFLLPKSVRTVAIEKLYHSIFEASTEGDLPVTYSLEDVDIELRVITDKKWQQTKNTLQRILSEYVDTLMYETFTANCRDFNFFNYPELFFETYKEKFKEGSYAALDPKDAKNSVIERHRQLFAALGFNRFKTEVCFSGEDVLRFRFEGKK